MVAFLKGKTCVTGKFWLVNLLRFKPGGAEEYQRYAAALAEPMVAVGAKPVFASYTCFTVVDGAGSIFPVDGVFIGEYPSASALVEMNKSPGYAAAHKHRAAALVETAMYAIPARWLPEEAQRRQQPNTSKKPPPSTKTGRDLEAIYGTPERFSEFMKDERFEVDKESPPPVWMLNFLRFEPGEGRALYQEYANRAKAHISDMERSPAGHGGGLALHAEAVHTLRGPRFDSIAIMKYPSRSAFLSFALGQGKQNVSDGSGNELVADGFKFRQAGLAVQGLVCMLPETIFGSPGKSRL
eukprot:TRINITY_DN60976_c0_g1_i1.p1 TRINITY_DN60976_c0_g1~~TRINITY_DN60976_c0_g1_i1.p1  ORF type:complete len:341 (+),score=58.63 TRINITY_DN60976_c0_g1_i1:133-1023(+)